jgi:hypothetical protein
MSLAVLFQSLILLSFQSFSESISISSLDNVIRGEYNVRHIVQTQSFTSSSCNFLLFSRRQPNGLSQWCLHWPVISIARVISTSSVAVTKVQAHAKSNHHDKNPQGTLCSSFFVSLFLDTIPWKTPSVDDQEPHPHGLWICDWMGEQESLKYLNKEQCEMGCVDSSNL